MKDFILLFILIILFGLGYFLMKKIDSFVEHNPKFGKYGTLIYKSDDKMPTDKMKENGVLILDDMDKTD